MTNHAAKEFLTSHAAAEGMNDTETAMALMDALNEADIPADQDWDNEATRWQFADGSAITVLQINEVILEP